MFIDIETCTKTHTQRENGKKYHFCWHHKLCVTSDAWLWRCRCNCRYRSVALYLLIFCICGSWWDRSVYDSLVYGSLIFIHFVSLTERFQLRFNVNFFHEKKKRSSFFSSSSQLVWICWIHDCVYVCNKIDFLSSPNLILSIDGIVSMQFTRCKLWSANGLK